MEQYDVIIVGAGPAGLTAALYSARSKLSTLCIEDIGAGGQAAITAEIENYPGFADGVNGLELSLLMEKQAQRFGAKTLAARVLSLRLNGKNRIVNTTKGEFISKVIIIASGATPKLLGCPGEAAFRARGVSYCATCDGPFYEKSHLLVVGGGDSAVEEACYLTKFASKVTLVHRRSALRAAKIIQERALANPKLEFIWNTVIEEIKGNNTVEKVIIKNLHTKKLTELAVDGVFIYVGIEPNALFVKNFLDFSEQGYLKTDECMQTAVPGIYAAGDVRHKLLRQIVTAVADGAIAAYHAEKYIEDQFIL